MRQSCGFVALLLAASTAWAQSVHGREGILLPAPPAAEAIPATEDHFGNKITDNYRWLEDSESPETRAFIAAQNAYAERYMRQAPIHSQAAEDLDALVHLAQWTLPIQRGGTLFFSKRLSEEEQASIYLRRGWKGKDERIVDPAQLSREADTSVELLDVSRDGAKVAYAVRQGDSPETTIHVAEVKEDKTGPKVHELEDELPTGMYSSVSFMADGRGLYYTRIGKAGTLLFQHRLGERIGRDTLLFGREFYGVPLGPADPFTAHVSDDGRYLIVTIDRGEPAHRVDIVFRDLIKAGPSGIASPFEVLVWDLEAHFQAVWAAGAWFVETDYKAPKGRVFQAYPGIVPDDWKPVIPEGPQPIANFSVVGGKIVLTRLNHVKPENAAYTLDGKAAGAMESDGFGTVSSVAGSVQGRYGFYRFESLLTPPAIYRFDTLTGKREVFAQAKASLDTARFELKQVFAQSKDGTQLPLLIAGKSGLKQDGTERLLLDAPRGFGQSATPHWSPLLAWWLAQGGWVALPAVRGGGEYGEEWHRQGILHSRQNALDDWFASIQYLINQKYTSASHLGLLSQAGGSLLAGVSLTQHPELFAAVVCDEPVFDLLRYQSSGSGQLWAWELGSAEKEKQFSDLLQFSPYRNAASSASYPAILLTIREQGAWAEPFHARKMAALLQSFTPHSRPVLFEETTEPQAGQGSGAGQSDLTHLDRLIQQAADRATFLWTETGTAAGSR